MADAPEISDTLQRLRTLRRALLSKLKDVDHAISELESMEQRLQLLSQPDLFSEAEEFIKSSAPEQEHASPAEIARRVEQLLREAGRPMVRSEIARALEQSGMVLGGKDRNKNVGTILWRHQDRFVNLRKLGYWLADTELPGVYKPPLEH